MASAHQSAPAAHSVQIPQRCRELQSVLHELQRGGEASSTARGTSRQAVTPCRAACFSVSTARRHECSTQELGRGTPMVCWRVGLQQQSCTVALRRQQATSLQPALGPSTLANHHAGPVQSHNWLQRAAAAGSQWGAGVTSLLAPAPAKPSERPFPKWHNAHLQEQQAAHAV